MGFASARGRSRAKKQFVSEALEPRTMLVTAYNFVTFAGPGSSAPTGDGALTVTPGATVTIRAFVDAVSTYGPQYNPDPSGTVTLEWFRTDNYGDPVPSLAGTGTLTTLSQGISYTDIQVALNLPTDPLVVQDQSGDYRLMGYYSGDSELFTDQSLPDPLNGVTGNAVEPYQQAFMGVHFNAANLAVIKQPQDTPVDGTLDPVKVAIMDTSGTINDHASGTVTVQLNPAATGTGKLTGTSTESFVDGVATFSSLSIDAEGQYGLSFTDSLGDTTTSGLFNINGGKLVFSVAPHDGTSGEALDPVVTVELRNAKNKLVTDDTAAVTLSLYGTNSTNSITGNTAVLSDGMATFPDLTLAKPGFYKLKADDGVDTDIVSSRFKIAGDHLVFVGQPTNGDVDTAIPLSVKILNADGKVDTEATSSIGLSLVTLVGGVDAVLSGVINAPFMAGIATFIDSAGPTVNVSGTYKLTATEEDTSTGVLAPTYTSTPVNSVKFTVSGLNLQFQKQPSGVVNTLDAIPVTIAVTDKQGDVDKSQNGSTVQLTLEVVSGGDGATLGGTISAPVINGVATFPASAAPMVVGVGTFKIDAEQIGGVLPATGSSHSFKVQGYHLKTVSKLGPFAAANPDVGDAADTAMIFGLYDAENHVVTSIDNLPNANVSVVAVSGNGTFSGTNSAGPQPGYRDGDAQHIFSLSTYTTQACYPAGFIFSQSGTYDVTISAAPPAGGSADNPLFAPLKIVCKVGEPILSPTFSTSPANTPVKIGSQLIKSTEESPTSPYNGMTPVAGVGAHLALISSSSDGKMSGTQDEVFGTEAISDSGDQISTYTIGYVQFPVSFSQPGIYHLEITEEMSSGIYDPATASAVLTTKPVEFTVQVQPDRVVFTGQPPSVVPANSNFTVTLELQDDRGNIVANSDAAGVNPLQAVLTYTTKTDPTPVTVGTPTLFSGGIATMTLSLPGAGVYRLHVNVGIYIVSLAYLGPLNPSLTADSITFVALPG